MPHLSTTVDVIRPGRFLDQEWKSSEWDGLIDIEAWRSVQSAEMAKSTMRVVVVMAMAAILLFSVQVQSEDILASTEAVLNTTDAGSAEAPTTTVAPTATDTDNTTTFDNAVTFDNATDVTYDLYAAQDALAAEGDTLDSFAGEQSFGVQGYPDEEASFANLPGGDVDLNVQEVDPLDFGFADADTVRPSYEESAEAPSSYGGVPPGFDVDETDSKSGNVTEADAAG